MNDEELNDQGSRTPDSTFNGLIRKIFFKDKTDGVAVECGAHCGYGGSVCHGFEELGWKVYNIEANPHCHEFLSLPPRQRESSLRTMERGDDYGFGITPKNEGYKFPAGSSVVLPVDYYGEKYLYSTIDVPVKTYKQFVEENGITHIDCFVLDVECAENDVLVGTDGCDVLPDVWVMENPKKPEYDCSEKLTSMGYIKHKATHTDNGFWYKEGFLS